MHRRLDHVGLQGERESAARSAARQPPRQRARSESRNGRTWTTSLLDLDRLLARDRVSGSLRTLARAKSDDRGAGAPFGSPFDTPSLRWMGLAAEGCEKIDEGGAKEVSELLAPSSSEAAIGAVP